jgi:hypothetical protein
MGGSAEDEAEEFLLPPSAIEAVAELGEVAGHVFLGPLTRLAELAGGDAAAAVVALQGAAQATLLVPEAAEL